MKRQQTSDVMLRDSLYEHVPLSHMYSYCEMQVSTAGLVSKFHKSNSYDSAQFPKLIFQLTLAFKELRNKSP